MRTAFYAEDGTAVGLDQNTPDRIAARKEALHPDDEDYDAAFAPDDGGETIDFDAIRNVPRDALKVLLRFLIPAHSPFARKRWRSMQLRTVILAHMIDLDGLGQKSFQQLGDELGCSRANLSLLSLRLVDGLSIEKSRNGKSRASRQVYRQTATEAHRRAGHRMSADKPAEDAL
jgi:biotin operon repressor